jgi:chemotaxis protein histidine kinase CheA
MSLLLGCFIAFTVLHLLTGQKYLNDIINNILQSKGVEVDNANEKAKEKKKEKDKEKKTENDKDKENEKKEEKENKKDDEKEQDNKKEEKNENDEKNQENKEKNKKGGRRKSLNKNSSKKRKSEAQNINVDEVQAPPKKESHKKRKSRHSISKDKNENKENVVVNTKMDFIDGKNNNKDKEETKEKKKHKHHHHHHQTDEKILLENAKGLNDEEMNSLYYEEALVIDKRSYFQYYLSLIRKKQLLIFTFYPNNDYNFTALKILLFIVSFSLYFTINGFFFNDDTMNKIYEDNGSYNILTTLPQIFYSSVVSAVINMILKKLSLTESQILEIKKEKDKKKAQDKAKKTKYSLSIKLIIFLVLSIILMLFFWYFISCFCAVYINTQKQLIGDTFLSFGLSMLYPFGLNLLPGLFRIPALRAPKKDKKYKYKISRYIAFI